MYILFPRKKVGVGQPFTLKNSATAYDFLVLFEGGTFVGNVVDFALGPEPVAVWLFGSGLIGLVGLARRKKAV